MRIAPLRLLLVADLHYTLPQFDWLVRAAPAFDVVVIAGDLLDISSTVPLNAQAVVVLRYLRLLHETTTLVVGSGNHDLTGPDARGEQAALWLAEARAGGLHGDGSSLRVGDALISVCPWWDGPLGREAVAAQLATDAAARPARWIWVYHWPPYGSPTCWTGKRHYGDRDVVDWIAHHQPDLVLTGHVHEPPFKASGHWAERIDRSWVFNAGRQVGPVPTHIELDLAAGTAVWRSMMGEETLQLDASAAPARSVF